jgi:penicillin-binding protein 1A
VLSSLTGERPGDREWSPRNAEGNLPAELTLRAALIESNNAAAADLQQKIGARTVLSVADEAGLTGLPDVPSLALGTGLVTPLDLTAAFTMFPGGGEVARPRGIIDVYDANATQVFEKPVERKRVVGAEVAFQMVSMLRDVIDRGTGSPARALGVRGAVGGKTGTTDDYHDAWFVGFSSVVWGACGSVLISRPDRPRARGARVALPIWADFMKARLEPAAASEFRRACRPQVEDLCSVSYLRPVEGLSGVPRVSFKSGDAIPSQSCPVHRGTIKRTGRSSGRRGCSVRSAARSGNLRQQDGDFWALMSRVGRSCPGPYAIPQCGDPPHPSFTRHRSVRPATRGP